MLADLTGVGDARDLLHKGKTYVATGDYDPLAVGMAVAGLTATAATIYSIGAASPSRVGVTALKFASKAGEIPTSLRCALVTLATETVDGPALKNSLSLFGKGTLAAGRQALTASILAIPFRTLETMTSELGNVISTRGYRAGRDVLTLAEHPRDFTRLRALASRFGKGFRGVVALPGATVLTFAGHLPSSAG